MNDPAVQHLVHELDVHRAELQARNEALSESQRLLEDSRDRFADLFEFAPVSYVTLSANGIIRELNLVAAGLLGVSRQHAVGMSFAALVQPDHQARFWDHMARCRRESLRLTTDLDLKPRGTDVRISVQVVTAPSSSGKSPDEFRTALLDITDRRVAEERRLELARESVRREEAERGSRAKDEMFSLLAHELRTPLNAVHGWTHLLAGGQLSEAEAQHAIRVIGRNVQAQVTLINDMLDVSRIMRGALEMRVQPMNLGDLLETAVDAIRPAAEQSGITVTCTIDPIAVNVVGDPDRLYQVVSNLLSNALKFTLPGGSVSARVERAVWSLGRGDNRDECARLTVRDTGMGVSSDDLAHVFEPFRKGKRAAPQAATGLGLGLTIVRRLVEIHGGEVRMTSAGVGQGTEVAVELPIGHSSRRELRPAAWEPKPGSGPPANLQGINVLMVDDDPDARELAHRMLEPLGAAVTTVPSAPAAYDALRAMRPDILVSDVAMPEEDGLSLIRRVRELPADQGGTTPAIALTAFAGAGDEDRVVAAGFQTFVAKPVEVGTLAGLIGSLVDLNRGQSNPPPRGHRVLPKRNHR